MWPILDAISHASRPDEIKNILFCGHTENKQISWTTSGPLWISLLRTAVVISIAIPRAALTPSDQSHWPSAYARLFSAWLTPGWYSVEKSSILDRNQCGFRKHCSTMVLKGNVLHLKKAYGTTWSHSIIQDKYRVDFKGRLPVFELGYPIDCWIWVRISTTLSNLF